MKTRENLEELGIRILNTSRTELLLSMRFMGSALDSLSYVMDLTTRTAGTDGVFIRFNPTFLMELWLNRPVHLNRLYVHILLHCIFRHVFTAEDHEDAELFDLCADIAVESVIDSMEYKAVQTTWSDFRQGWYERLEKDLGVLTAEKLYRHFTMQRLGYDDLIRLHNEFTKDDHAFWQRLQEQKEEKDGSRQPEDHPEEENKKSDSPVPSETEDKWKSLADRVKVELEAAGSGGSMEYGSFLRTLRFVQKRRRGYTDFLKRFSVLHEETKVDPDSFDYAYYTFGMDMYGNIPLIEENEYREAKKIRTLVIALDTSGSCQATLVQRFLNETADILQRQESFFRHAEVLLLECDNVIQEEIHFTDPQEMKKYAEGFQIRGGFGTDFRPVFRRVGELLKEGRLINLKGMMYFTDGFGLYPESPPSWETAFVLYREDPRSEPSVPEWAYTLYLDWSDL